MGKSPHDSNVGARRLVLLFGIVALAGCGGGSAVDRSPESEPCETFSKEDLEEYSEVLRTVAKEAREDPEMVKNAPHKCAAHKRSAEEELDDPTKLATTWRAYQRKHGKA